MTFKVQPSQLTGCIILFLTITVALQLYLFLKEAALLVLFFIPLALYFSPGSPLTSGKTLRLIIDNLTPVAWIVTVGELIYSLHAFSLSFSLWVNLGLFIAVAYGAQFVLQKLYISVNVTAEQPALNQLDKFQFTEREKELIQYLIKGLKYKEIAAALFISENTVKKHISNIYSKAAVNNKVELIYKISSSH
ncbi:response regulator transcription factor [Vibrio quintilis]|uniref:CsgBAC operon transcriptional regulatory protein n=1 Tax=Vibrio quintilis TaxID=1117707 RepID=A0A1M7Z2C4_9VIBR|nr:LuxR C-terminal-related transcriptional regulator [Vibrio quintilis]SHO59108.1 CsgBAC operon transcriptional regulatory protein [Vibrio quintilis]